MNWRDIFTGRVFGGLRLSVDKPLTKEGLQNWKYYWGEVELTPRPLGCRTIGEVMEAATILEDLRQEEGVEIMIICDNPDFHGPNSRIEVCWSWTATNVGYSGETVLEALRAAKAGRP